MSGSNSRGASSLPVSLSQAPATVASTTSKPRLNATQRLVIQQLERSIDTLQSVLSTAKNRPVFSDAALCADTLLLAEMLSIWHTGPGGPNDEIPLVQAMKLYV
jgi:hypothetical protein